MEEIALQDFGFSEMYEWSNSVDVTPGEMFALFTTFDKNNPDKIKIYGESDEDMVLGITTINTVTTSDDPNDWKYRYMTTNTGDILLQKEVLAVGQKLYDEGNEMAFIKTFPWEHLIRIENKQYDPTKNYVKRSNRNEWIRVSLLGKTFVKDDGTLKPGDYCKPYVGKIKNLWGKAVKAEKTDVNKYYVLNRVSDDVVMILYK